MCCLELFVLFPSAQVIATCIATIFCLYQNGLDSKELKFDYQLLILLGLSVRKIFKDQFRPMTSVYCLWYFPTPPFLASVVKGLQFQSQWKGTCIVCTSFNQHIYTTVLLCLAGFLSCSPLQLDPLVSIALHCKNCWRIPEGEAHCFKDCGKLCPGASFKVAESAFTQELLEPPCQSTQQNQFNRSHFMLYDKRAELHGNFSQQR